MPDTAEQRSGRRLSGRLVELPPCEDLPRRRRYERNCARWLRYYCAGAYPMAFGDVHQEIIDGVLHAAKTGGRYVVAAPRGTGKSTVVNGVVFFLLVTGVVRFPVVVPWKNKDAKRALNFWLNCLSWNGRIAADYPEYCVPFVAGKGSSQKVKTIGWKHTGETAGAQVTLSEGIIILPDALGVLGSASMNGSPRGLQFTADNGQVWRPDLIIPDDPSDKDTARSVSQTGYNIEFLEEDVLGMGGPDRKIAACMTCTRITTTDTASHYLGEDAPDWIATSMGQITAWPKDWKDRDSETHALWDEWNQIRLEALRDKDPGRSPRGFYRKHKKAMIKGMAVSWRHRYDKERQQPDAFYAAMEDFYTMGEKAFMQERQNEPQDAVSQLYSLSVETVSSATNGLARRAPQEQGMYITAGIDINIGREVSKLSWAVASITWDLATAAVDYGQFPEGNARLWSEDTGVTAEQAVAAGIRHVVNQLSRQYPDMFRLCVDGNFATDTVYRTCEALNASLPFDVIPARGVGSRQYHVPEYATKRLRKRADQCHILRQFKRGLSLWFNSHHWHKHQQMGFMMAPLTAGSVSLFGTDKHTIFAQQVCSDRLVGIAQRDDGREVHEWNHDRSMPNDMSDALTMAIVAAAVEGAKPDGDNLQKKPETPKPKKRFFRIPRKPR